MIAHVMRRAIAANIGPVFVACCDNEVANAVKAVGGRAIMTDPDLPSGSDRVNAALDIIDPLGQFEVVINLQGDMPTIAPALLNTLVSVMEKGADMATLAVETLDLQEITDPNVVKVVMTSEGRALYFSRAALPHGLGPVFHHLGVYAYRRKSLAKFCRLPPSPLEQRERLEQLRALEAGMQIDVAIVESAPIGVDTPEDLRRVIAILEDE